MGVRIFNPLQILNFGTLIAKTDRFPHGVIISDIPVRHHGPSFFIQADSASTLTCESPLFFQERHVFKHIQLKRLSENPGNRELIN